MNQTYTITVEMRPYEVYQRTVGLLVPIASTLDTQQCDDIRFSGRDGARKVMDSKGVQAAWFIPAELMQQAATIEYDFSVPTVPIKQSSACFQTGEVGEWTRALGYSLEHLGLTTQQRDCRDKTIEAIVGYINDKFEYVSSASTGELGNLTCDLLSGNCIDINKALMTLLSEAGIEHCYLSGVYASEHQGLAKHGWHCWVATRSGGKILYWDIAHHLQSGIHKIKPGLNPAGGVRFALAQGTDLQFEINRINFKIKRLPLPTVLFNDGSSELTLPKVTFNSWKQ